MAVLAVAVLKMVLLVVELRHPIVPVVPGPDALFVLERGAASNEKAPEPRKATARFPPVNRPYIPFVGIDAPVPEGD